MGRYLSVKDIHLNKLCDIILTMISHAAFELRAQSRADRCWLSQRQFRLPCLLNHFCHHFCDPIFTRSLFNVSFCRIHPVFAGVHPLRNNLRQLSVYLPKGDDMKTETQESAIEVEVLILYDNVCAGKRAKELCDRLQRHLGSGYQLNLSLWNLAAL